MLLVVLEGHSQAFPVHSLSAEVWRWPNLVILCTMDESNFFLRPLFLLKKFDLGAVNYFIYAMLVSFWLVIWTHFSPPGWRVLCNVPCVVRALGQKRPGSAPHPLLIAASQMSAGAWRCALSHACLVEGQPLLGPSQPAPSPGTRHEQISDEKPRPGVGMKLMH